jgi:hypothetical protein
LNNSRALEAIEASDTDELIRVVDGYCAAKSWDDLVELRARCREAVGRGKQVWGVEEHIRYRLALEAPPEYAGPVVSEGHSRFTLGPLPEVAASTKTFAEMDGRLSPGPARDTFAAERVVRGEQIDIPIPDLPSRLQDWEPQYPIATYKPDKVEAPAPPLPELTDTTLPTEFETIDDPHSTGALGDLVEPWTDQSNGRCQTTSVAGNHLAAIRSLGLARARAARLEPSLALAWMSWAAASGGAHGRRRGVAAGRYMAWWAVATLADLDWPASPEAIRDALENMQWFWFDDGSPDVGWVLRLAVHDPVQDMSWAIVAVDIS